MPSIAPADRGSLAQLFAWLGRDRIEWARRCFRILDKFGAVIALEANPAQRLVYEAEQRQLRERGYVRSYVLKARQGGVSTWEQASNLHQIWSEPGFNAITLAHTREDTDKLFGITQRGIDHFPRHLLPGMGGKETREISFPGLMSRFWTGTAGAKRTGRSLTIKRGHGSEFAFWDDPRGTLNALTPALVPQGSILTLETTASGYDSEPHTFWREAEAGTNGYVPIFIPWWKCDIGNYRLPLMEPDELGQLEEDERDLVALHDLTHEQLKWRRAKIREMGRGPFLQEYAEDAETCWAAAGGMVYDAEVLKYLLGRAPTPTDTDLAGTLEVYGQHFGEPVVIGADTAEGVGQDRSTFVARTYPARRPLASFADPGMEPEEFAGLLNTWGRKYASQGEPAFLVVEKNMHGITVLRKLRDFYKYPVARLYHRQTQDEANRAGSDKIGWHTGAETKGLLVDAGRDILNAARDGMAGIPCKAALRDAFAIRRDPKTGKVDLNGRDVMVAEMLCEIGHQAWPHSRSWWLGPVGTKGGR
jgi:hypothetical protein